MGEERTKRKLLVLDWNKLLPNRDEEHPPILVVEPTSTEFPEPSSDDNDREQEMRDFHRTFSDKVLEDKILCRKKNYDESAMKLPDGGKKLLKGLKLLEEEKERRKLIRAQEAQPVLLVDEEESCRMETPELVDEQEQHHVEIAEVVDERMKEVNIYYPSSDDPESVDIRFDDIKCLGPEGYLTSTIMNFYIRYLQQQGSSTPEILCDYYFFNTFFYKKLKEAVSNKGKDKDTFFVKFRRWWKGVNIFQKAYVFIPIHEDLHWILVIICMPDKEDESGPMILHLDSLGFHSSRSVFDNVKGFMKEEWYYLDKTIAASDSPLADRIWKHLPRRIDEKIITVPQQKNDCDCGLFVLFFIKRFIEEAPERLKRKDLTMFNSQWFKPEEASSLRSKIKNLLMQEFEKAVACASGPSRTPIENESTNNKD